MTIDPRIRRPPMHISTRVAIAPHQQIRRGMPLARVGDGPEFVALVPNAPHGRHDARAIASQDVVTGDAAGDALAVTEGEYDVAQLQLAQGLELAAVSRMLLGAGVRIVDPYEPEQLRIRPQEGEHVAVDL